MSILIVTANGVQVGTLEVKKGQWKFGYATEWKDYALSPNFPIVTGKFEDTANDKPVEWFFENLLPEGRLRNLIATRDRIDPRDTWALLVRHGQDTAGALSLTPEGLAAATKEILVPLSRETLQEKIKLMPMVRCFCQRVLHPLPILSNLRMPAQIFRIVLQMNFSACAWLMS